VHNSGAATARWAVMLREQLCPRQPRCPTPEDSARCSCGARDRVLELCQAIDDSARVVDSGLPRPARWRGQTRRELLGHCAGTEAVRYRNTFDWVVSTREPATEDRVIEIHERVLGSRAYRTCHVWVDDGYRHPGAEEIPKLMRLAFARLNGADSAWPVPARALGLHLDLVAAHPFTDGNGRTARLAAAGVLAGYGYKSTLLTAVEEFFHRAPRAYLESLVHYRSARACRTWTIEQLLVAMAASSAPAAWARANGLSSARASAPDYEALSASRLPADLRDVARRSLLAQLQRIGMEEREARDQRPPAS
jgi:Fic/DOC family protein